MKSNVYGFLVLSSVNIQGIREEALRVVFVPAVYGIQKVPNWKQEWSSWAVGYQVGLCEYRSQSWRCAVLNTRKLLTLQLLPNFDTILCFALADTNAAAILCSAAYCGCGT